MEDQRLLPSTPLEPYYFDLPPRVVPSSKLEPERFEVQPKTQCALPSLVIDHEQVIDLTQRAECFTGALCASALGTAHEHSSPSVGRGIADSTEKGLAKRCMKGTWTK